MQRLIGYDRSKDGLVTNNWSVATRMNPLHKSFGQTDEAAIRFAMFELNPVRQTQVPTRK